MSTPRRRLIRPDRTPTPAPSPAAVERQREKLRVRVVRERATLTRWLGRLKRAFTAFVKSERCLARLECRLARLEE
jgi:hypothetical protein